MLLYSWIIFVTLTCLVIVTLAVFLVIRRALFRENHNLFRLLCNSKFFRLCRSCARIPVSLRPSVPELPACAAACARSHSHPSAHKGTAVESSNRAFQAFTAGRQKPGTRTVWFSKLFQKENTDKVRGSSLKIFRLFRYREYTLGKRNFPKDFQTLPL
jgi:hypothetical protein